MNGCIRMLVWNDHIEGTIGGGALEWQAIAAARRMFATGTVQETQTIPLGPALGQCCGGSVTLAFAETTELTTKPKRPLWVYGAGHVGRARFPETDVTTLIAKDPAQIVKHAPENADHLILTYSHDIDLALCHALLLHQFASAGLIGSTTKWTRFRKRLQALGHAPAQITRIACPIGDPMLGKHPAAIALGVATAMITPQNRATKDHAG